MILYIDGIPLYDMMINLPRFETNYYQHRDYALDPYSREENVSAWCRVPRAYSRALQLWGYTGCQKTVGVLGKGYVCNHCGDYNPSGSLICLKCGGFSTGKWIRPTGFSFYVSSVTTANRDALVSDQTMWLDLDIEFPKWTEKAWDAVAIASERGGVLTTGYSLDSGLYLCKYCGMAVYEGDTCPGCSGKRLPFQELVTIERKCVYCGREVLGSIFCPGCGARIKGLTFGKVFMN
jgi:hypothetical protein